MALTRRALLKQMTEADYCVCTIPLPVLARIPSDFSPAKKAAIAGAAPYLHSVKVGFEAPRFWERDDEYYDCSQVWPPESFERSRVVRLARRYGRIRSGISGPLCIRLSTLDRVGSQLMRTKRVLALFMRAGRVCVLAIVGSLNPTQATAQTAESLKPTKPWNLDYGETQCTAAREYGDPADPIAFAIRPAPNGETYELVIARKRSGPALAEEQEGMVTFNPGAAVKAWLLHYGAKVEKVEFRTFRIDAAEMAKASNAISVTLRSDNRPSVTFGLANMPAVLKGLEECTADLKRYWNMDSGVAGAIAVPSKGDVRKIFSDSDYPTEALTRMQGGTSQFLLLINEQGKVAGCHLMKASGAPALDGMGCQVIRERAKFTPARDKTGKPIRSTYITPPVRWRI